MGVRIQIRRVSWIYIQHGSLQGLLLFHEQTVVIICWTAYSGPKTTSHAQFNLQNFQHSPWVAVSSRDLSDRETALGRFP